MRATFPKPGRRSDDLENRLDRTSYFAGFCLNDPPAGGGSKQFISPETDVVVPGGWSQSPFRMRLFGLAEPKSRVVEGGLCSCRGFASGKWATGDCCCAHLQGWETRLGRRSAVLDQKVVVATRDGRRFDLYAESGRGGLRAEINPVSRKAIPMHRLYCCSGALRALASLGICLPVCLHG